MPRAQVATDLAVIYLMDSKPEKALQAINGSRTTVLPAALNAERRLIEARAWAGVGRYDSALEIIGHDPRKEAQDLRGEITWKQKDWAKPPARLFEKALGDRWKTPTPLSSEEEGKLLRAGVAYSLAGDDAALSRLNGAYQGFYRAVDQPRGAAHRADPASPAGGSASADFGRVTADNEAFSGWVEKMKVRFKTRPAPVGAGKPAVRSAAPARQAQVAAPAPSKG